MTVSLAAAVSPARRCAYVALRRVFERGAYADRALHAEARGLEPRDRALATRLVFGTVQRRATLDHLIETLAERPASEIDPPLLAALRLGLEQLLFFDQVPQHAAVHESVELAKAAGRGAGLVNAVLRRGAREGAALLAALDDATPQAAALRHSHPEWLARMWWDALGADDARALLARDNEPAELALRANSLVLEAPELVRRLPVAARAVGDPAEAVVVDGPFDAHGSPLWHAGAFMPQSRAAMLVAHALAPRAGEHVLDLCAAPGGKTTHVAALMGAEGRVVAVERHPGRARALERTCARMHAACVEVAVADAAAPGVPQAGFDRVLLDPPCSGLGTLQARPDLRWRATPDSLERLAAEQAAMLHAAAAETRPGGTLVYSTCTIAPRENELQIDAFIAAHPEFAADSLGSEFPAYAHRRRPEFLLSLPHRDATDGFFIARLRRNTEPKTGR